jgi:energy-coupling factor transporter ATP-binding protein EcfA2
MPEMDLFKGSSSSHDVREQFQSLLRNLNRSSTSSTKNKPIESFLMEHTGWPAAGFKYVGDKGVLYNRISEIRNRPDEPRYVIVLVPGPVVELARNAALKLVDSDRRYDAVGIVADDPENPVITDFVHLASVEVPRELSAAFPEMKARLVESAEEKLGSPSAGRRASISAVRASDSESKRVRPTYSVAKCAEDTHIDPWVLESWLRRLERKKHLVFQGPPGTGKTYLAKHLADVEVSGSHGEVELVQFHPSYSYEDFVQGIRPIVVDGAVQYDLVSGRFLNFCDRALRNPTAPHVLIIDELNRGNVSKIFGELMYLLEYRSDSIYLAQGDVPFSVPGNVRIIATMNTADRSIALIDHAFRRRFSFVFLAPDYSGLQKHLDKLNLKPEGAQLVDVLKRVNAAIGDRNYHLGTSYFLTAGVKLPAELPEIWEGEIEPYLEEYFFDQPEKVADFRWSKLVKAELSEWVKPRT